MDEDELLAIWLEHYLSFLDPSEIIIADNNSTNPATLNIYERLDEQLVIFTYESMPGKGDHDVVHSRSLYKDLYIALERSCSHYAFFDTDELLYYCTSERWSVDRSDIFRCLSLNYGKALPTFWLDTLPGTKDKGRLGYQKNDIYNLIAWGKPILPSNCFPQGFLLHNCQYQAELFGHFTNQVLFLLHLKEYSPRQRLLASRRKLVSMGLATIDMDFRQIIELDYSDVVGQKNAQRFQAEISKILSSEASNSNPALPDNTIYFAANGAIQINQDATHDVYLDLFRESRTWIQEGLEYGRSHL